MTNIVAIVEGDGEVAAVPVLMRRIGRWLTPAVFANVLPPIRVHKDQFLNRAAVLSKQLQLAAMKCGDDGWILILRDADDDCPVDCAADILARAQAIIPHRRIAVVLANREYEAWFLAAAKSLDGKRGLRIDDEVADPDGVRGAKEWLSRRIANGRYREVTDQPALSAAMDLGQARQSSRSFRHLCTVWERHMGAATAPP